MKKILLAVGHRQLEEYLKSQLDKEFDFVGTTVYREGIVKSIEQKSPNIIIIRETLEGTKNIMSVIYEIRSNFPDIRIIFLAGNREAGDELLATLVNYGVYDILNGENIPAQKIISLIKTPNTYDNIKHFQPVPLLDEDRGKMLFEAPESKKEIEIIEVVKEVDKEKDDLFDGFIYTNKGEEKEEKTCEPNKNILSRINIPQVIKRERKTDDTSQMFSDIDNVVNEKIITFVGGKNGVGTTTLAINTAFILASKKYKVIFIEFNEKYPSVSYWYELGFVSEGIETCIDSIFKKEYKKIDKAIIKSFELKKKETVMQKNYKLFPSSLDFMFYSKEFLSGLKENEDIKMRDSKELFLYLIYQLGYDFVIVDVLPDIKNEITQNGLIFSNKVFSVITQDVSSIGYYLFNFNNFEKIGINIGSKNNFILNKYIKSNLTRKDIKDWIETDDLLTVPYFGSEFINANFKGLPVVINSENPELLSSINNIVNTILK